MLFNSYLFIFLFLPVTVAGYYLLNRFSLWQASKVWLLAASLFFYGYWVPQYLVLLGASVLVNFAIGSGLGDSNTAGNGQRVSSTLLLVTGITFNLGLLGVFKYTDFFLETVNNLSGSHFPLPGIILPLGISFFTFQQISYLVDCHQNKARSYTLLDYGLFVSFFPQLIAGPIVHHAEMMPQFHSPDNRLPKAKNIYNGLFLFSVGLAKKGIIADSFALWANYGFGGAGGANLVDAWITSLSYTFQIYFDFSGYMDMALGAALLLNIKLPANFNAPYQALSIQDFWRRWHITLGRFLMHYLYFPLGGNRKGLPRTLVNIFAVFVLGGLWHGASWTFVAWGALHGTAMAVHRLWQFTPIRLPKYVSWLLTFTFVNVTWVFFRAATIQNALDITRAMFGLKGFVMHPHLQAILGELPWEGIAYGPWNVGQYVGTTEFVLLTAIFGFAGCLLFRPARVQAEETGPSLAKDLWLCCSLCFGVLSLSRITEFIYFQF